MAINLFGLEKDVSGEIKEKLTKRSLSNLLSTYADEADVFAELIQNAVDTVIEAIDKDLYSDSEDPQIDIIIGRRSNDSHYFAVKDNGMGMESEVAENFTIPNYSAAEKRRGKTIGYKGVGASSVFAASNKASLATVSLGGEETEFTALGSYKWIMNDSEPRVEISREADFPEYCEESKLIPNNRGTLACFYFHEGWDPDSLSFLVKRKDNLEKELKGWATFLCAHTALGQVKDISEKGIKVNIHLDKGNKEGCTTWTFGKFEHRQDNRLGYPFPHQIFKVAKEKKEIDKTPVSQKQKHKNKHQAIHHRWTKEEVQNFENMDFDQGQKILIEEHFDFFDLYFAYSTDVIKEIKDRTECISSILPAGIRMACDGIPQGRMLDFGLKRYEGYSKQAHGVISFSGLELDMGRKVPSDETVTDISRKIGVRTMNILFDYRWAMRTPERDEPQSDIDGWINKIK